MSMLLQNFRVKASLKYLVLLTLILLIAIFQDLFFPKNDYSDFNANPVLVNTFWIFVLPISIVLARIFTSGAVQNFKHDLLLRRTIFALVGSFVHILLFSVLMQVLSIPMMGQSIQFTAAFGFAIFLNLYNYLLIYSIVGLILLKKKS